MNYKNLVPPIVFMAYRRLRGLDRPRKGDVTHVIGDLAIELPSSAALPLYQRRHRLYDRFLPVLVEHVDGAGWIVDVGANVGDSAIAMLQHCGNPILCVEASDLFFPYLERNIAALPSAYGGRVEIVKHLVGTGEFTGTLKHAAGGTAELDPGSGEMQAAPRPLDEILGERTGRVALLKVDTDGFDHDVLMSARRVLKESRPILFWENHAMDERTDHAYQRMYRMIAEHGYTSIHVFDNYGAPMLVNTDLRALADLNAYIIAQYKYGGTRTMYYTDVLAATEEDRPKVEAAIAQYRQQWVQRKPQA
jgi:FkbM family methyltransferase